MLDFSNLEVLVIGDVALDIYEDGISNRLSPEFPVPVILNPSQNYFLGMAANVALNLHNLGANAYFKFLYGEDENGIILNKLLQETFDDSITTYPEGNSVTTTKKRILANGQQLARIDFEKQLEYSDVKYLISQLEKDIKNNIKYDIIIISDYNKGIITKESWKEIKPLLEKLSDKFYVDTKKKNVLDFYEGMYIFPNQKEMAEIMEYNNCYTKNQLRIELDLDFIIETASKDGAFLYKNDGKIFHSPAPTNNNIVDVTGCGDTFMAAFTLHYTKYNNKRKALDFANYCCAKVIQKKGTASVYLHEVMDFTEGWG